MRIEHSTATQSRRDFLVQHGSHPLAYSTLQEKLSYFDHKCGYVAYRTVESTALSPCRLVMGEPISDEESWSQILADFLGDGVDTTFYQVGARFAGKLEERGFNIVPFGFEGSIRLPFNLKGKYRSDVRRMVNSASSCGVRVLELTREDRRMRGISDASLGLLVYDWLSRRVVRSRELTYLVRPLCLDDEFGVRKFYALFRGEAVGIAVYDPLYRDGSAVGFTESVVRIRPDAPKGTRDFLLKTALLKFGVEGYEVCSLGLSPLAPLPTDLSPESTIPVSMASRWIMRLIYHALDNVVFNFKGTRFKKSRYVRPELGEDVIIRPVYVATRRKLPLIDSYHLALAMGVSPWRQIVRLPRVAVASLLTTLPALIGIVQK